MSQFTATIASLIGKVWAVVCSGAVQTKTAAAEEILAKITIPAGILTANSIIRIFHTWTNTNNANSKIIRVRFGTNGTTADTQVFIATITTTVSYRTITEIAMRNATNSQGVFPASGLGTNTGALNTAAIDITGVTYIDLTGEVTSHPGDALQLEFFVIEIFNP